MAELPSGTVTLLFSDIEGSTRLSQHLGDRYPELLHRHRTLLRHTFAGCGGVEVSTEGDGMFVAFSRAADGVVAAANAQRALASHPWPADAAVKVRIGLHTGEPVVEAEDYTGYDVSRAARICASGHGGQIVVSDVTRRLAGDVGGGIRFVDLGEHRLKDLAYPERLYQVVAPDVPEHFPPLRSEGMSHSNLHGQLTSFVGRERELEALRDLVVHHRLVTLTGPGGAGKTRLALQAAHGLRGHFADGLWIVTLAAVTDPGLVARAIAGTIGLRDAAGETSLDTLVRYAHGKRLLLVLDNFEHLMPAAEMVGELVHRTSTVNVLITTREALKIRGEREMSIPPMQVPRPRESIDHTRLIDVESVRLFVDRAQAALPGFQLTGDNAAPVAAIVQQLDGLPLAIELAAARVKVLSPPTLSARLGDRLAVLTGGPRDLPTRQRTLRATVEWSYDLLADEERALLQRMSVFKGPVGLETVEAVCGWNDVDVLTVLTALVDKSLVRRAERKAGEAFWTLETIKVFALEKLQEGEDADRVHQRHTSRYERLAEQAEDEILGPRQLPWLNRIDDEHDDFQAAIFRSLQLRAFHSAARICTGIAAFWLIRGHYKTGRYWLQRVLTAGLDDPPLRGRLLVATARLAVLQGDFRDIHEQLAAAETAARQCGDELLHARALAERASLHVRVSDEGGEEAAYEALAVFRRLGDVSAEAEVLLRIGFIQTRRGRYGEAMQTFHESLRLMRAAGNSWGVATALNDIGYLAALQCRFEEARPYLEESRQLMQAVGTREGLAIVFDTLALITAGGGDWDAAIELYEQSLSLFRDMDILEGIAFEQVHLGRARLERGEHRQAAICLLEGLQLAEQINEEEAQAFAFEGTAALVLRTGRAEEAAELFAAAQSFRESVGVPLSPVDRRRVERDLDAIATQVDPAALRRASKRGSQMARRDLHAAALAAMRAVAADHVVLTS